MYKIRFRLGLRARPHLGNAGGVYSAPLHPWLHLRGRTSKGSGGEGGRVNGEKKGRKGVPQSSQHIDAPACESYLYLKFSDIN